MSCPVLAALTLWFTYLLGREATGSRTVAALAALLLLASPVFLTHVMVPMSDVPAAAGWTLVAVLVLKQRSLAAGIVAGLTLLIRPNLILLALVPVFAWQGRREPLIRYAMGIVPGLLAVMIINVLLYGGPLTTGYASLFELYAFGALPLNVRNYVVWLVQTQTPLILLALVPLFVPRRAAGSAYGLSPRACLAAIVGLTFLSYCFMRRSIIGSICDSCFRRIRRCSCCWRRRFVGSHGRCPSKSRVPAAALVCAAMVPFGVNVGRHEGIFDVAAYEGRHVRAAQEVASRTPADAIVLSVQHSGSVRYYANRITLRYDWLQDGALDAALRDLAAKGRRAYLVVDDWEEKEFRARFSPANRAAQLVGAHRARAGQPRSAHFRVAGRRPCADAMKKGALVFLIYCAITIALTYPLIVQMGSVLPNDAGDPALNTWILWWNTQTVPFSTAVVERAGVFSRARGAELFGKPAGPESDFHAAALAGRGTTDGVQRRVSSDVSFQRCSAHTCSGTS